MDYDVDAWIEVVVTYKSVRSAILVTATRFRRADVWPVEIGIGGEGKRAVGINIYY